MKPEYKHFVTAAVAVVFDMKVWPMLAPYAAKASTDPTIMMVMRGAAGGGAGMAAYKFTPWPKNKK